MPKLLEIEGLVVHATGQMVPLVDDVDLSIDTAESIGLVGESGSGKTLTVQAIMNILPQGLTASCRSFSYLGRDIALGSPEHTALIGGDMTLVFQDPFASLNPCYTVGFQLSEVLMIKCHMEADAALKEAAALMHRVGIADPELRLNAYPHQLSGGMIQRVMIAMSLAVSPRLLIADEPTTALDVTIQAQILALLRRLTREQGMALAMISHNLAIFPIMADRLYVMYAGQMIEEQATTAIIAQPRHPYTRALLDALPEYAQERTLKTIPGFVPEPAHRPHGCVFHPRCTFVQEKCRKGRPEFKITNGAKTRCYFPLEGLVETPSSNGITSSFSKEKTPVIMSGKGLSRRYALRGWPKREVNALNDVSFSVRGGQTLGVVGESGSGKSTLARLITLVEKPDDGTLEIDSTARLGNGVIQMIFQDPFASLNPRRTIGPQLEDPLRFHTKWPAQRRKEHIRRMLSEIGLEPEHEHAYPHMFSGGQRQRLALLRAIIHPPRVLVADEPVSALDISVQAQIINLLNDMQDRLGFAMILISHDLSVVRHIADNVMVLYLGKVMEYGPTHEVFAHPRHPYTKLLLESSPRLRMAAPPQTIQGEMASPISLPSGCLYHQRCAYAVPKCSELVPELSTVNNNRDVRCLRVNDILQ